MKKAVQAPFRKFVGWLVNFFPNTVFWCDRFMPDLLIKLDDERPHSSRGSTILIGLAVMASRVMEPGAELTSEFTGVTNKGRDVGDYEITIRRLR